MNFEEFLKTRKIKVKRDKTKCKFNYSFSLNFPENKQYYNHITNEDMQRLKIMEGYLSFNFDISQSDFLLELKRKFKDYYKLVQKYPYKNNILSDLRMSAEEFAMQIEYSAEKRGRDFC